MSELIDKVGASAQGGMIHTIVVAVVIVAVTVVLSSLATRLIRRILRSDGVPLPSCSILVNIARAAIWVIGLSTVLSACFGVDVNGLVAAIGVGGIAISLGLQDTMKNFIGGLQVTLMKIVKPGDHIQVGTTDGIVQDVLDFANGRRPHYDFTSTLTYDPMLLVSNYVFRTTTAPEGSERYDGNSWLVRSVTAEHARAIYSYTLESDPDAFYAQLPWE